MPDLLQLTSYSLYVESQFQKEAARCQDCLDISSKHTLLSILEETLIRDVLQSGINENASEFAKLISQNRVEDLTRLCVQLKRVEPTLAKL